MKVKYSFTILATIYMKRTITQIGTVKKPVSPETINHFISSIQYKAFFFKSK